ncbi:MAG: BatD family protein [Flavobacteriaceae bacterium]
MKKLWFTFLFCFAAAWSIQAQEAALSATASKTKVAKNGRFRVEFTINKQGADHFKAPDFENFRVISGPMTSIKQSWVNGKSSYKQSYIYTLSPSKFGDLTIAPASIEYKGETFKSEPLKIQVVDEEDLPKNPNDPYYIAKENVHLVTRVSKKKPFVGEGIYVEYRLYFSQNIGLRDFNPTNIPNYDGFWHEEIDIKNAEVKTADYNGEPYRYVTLRKSVLIPQRSGTLVVDNMAVDIALQIPTDQADFFGNRLMKNINRSFNSGKKVINVQALPELGKPENFKGAVGSFKLFMSPNKTALKSNESVQIEVGVSGKGNLKLFETPEIVAPSELEVYAPEHFEKVKKGTSGLSGKVYDAYTIVPQKSGTYRISGVDFSYFDPKKKAYVSLESEDVLLKVSGGTSVAPIATGVDKQEVVAVESLKYIETETLLQPREQESFFGSNKFYLLLLLPMLAIPLGIFIGKAREARRADVAGNKRRRADRLAKKYLSEAKKQIRNKNEFYIALERALHNYLKAILAVETADIEKENIKKLLSEKGVGQQEIDAFIQVFDDCEFARYTPITDSMMQEEYEKAKEAISQIDKQL